MSDPVTRTDGLHLLGELRGCDATLPLMRDETVLRALCIAQVERHGFTAVGECFHRFPCGAGVTGVVVLAESHVAVHTWPEGGYVTLDVFACNHSCNNAARAEALFEALVARFLPESVCRHRIVRA